MKDDVAAPRNSLEGLDDWLVREARLFDSPIRIVTELCERMVAAGLPLIRCRIGQRLANPLISAWGVVWRLEGAEEYLVDRATLGTVAYHGSPFQAIIETRAPVRFDLTALGPDAHETLVERREQGGADYLGIPFIYGDGSVQGGSFIFSERLSEAETARVMDLRHALAAALEPEAMRRSARSLLQTYLGSKPTESILSGAFRRGDIVHLDAVVLFADLCGSSGLSERCSEAELLDILDIYFEAVVDGVQANRGEVLKFLGDGVLAIFPIDENTPEEEACARAVGAVEAADTMLRSPLITSRFGGPFPCFASALHLGPVAYGNIGSRDRLDFTVVGKTVNLVARLEEEAKAQPNRIICSKAFADAWGGIAADAGTRQLKGFSTPQEIYTIERRMASR